MSEHGTERGNSYNLLIIMQKVLRRYLFINTIYRLR
jgi:hypothetical protein